MSLGLGDAAEPRFVSLTVAPLGGDGRTADHLVITVVDATETVQTRRQLEAAEAAQKQLVDELNATNARLNATNKDLQDANEELQAANEELMLAQEELQATNEEFEATNEELQATNEELETNNEELQATNEELDTTNEELQARSAELHDVNTSLRLQRERLVEIVERAPLPVVVLPGAGRGRRELQPAVRGHGRAMRSRVGHDVDETFAGLPEVARGLRGAIENGEVWVSGPQRLGANARRPTCRPAPTSSPRSPLRRRRRVGHRRLCPGRVRPAPADRYFFAGFIATHDPHSAVPHACG